MFFLNTLFKFFVLFSILGAAPYVMAMSCETAMSIDTLLTAPKTEHANFYQWSFLPKVHELPLPLACTDQILNHHGLKQLSQQTAEGSELVFWFPQILKDGSIGALPGEGIQSLMLQKVLRIAFPKAEFINQTRPAGRKVKSKRIIRIMPEDYAEDGYLVPPVGTLRMDILKNGNPTGASISKQNVRTQFGLNGRRRVVHIYSSFYFEPTASYFRAVLKGARPDLLFLTGGRNQLKVVSALMNDRIIAKVLFLSELGPKDIEDILAAKSPQSTVVIINNISGIKIYLDAVSNFSIVNGAINHAEALTVGTPVISFLKDATGGYNSVVLENRIADLILTGGLFRANNLASLKAATSQLISEAHLQIQPPAFTTTVENNQSSTLFLRVLDHLSEFLARSLSANK